MNITETRNAIGHVFQKGGLGDNRIAMQNLFYGINHQGFGNAVPANTDHYGYTFFTKPCLNLSYHNVLNERCLSPLLNADQYSVPNAIRAYLDVVSNRGQ